MGRDPKLGRVAKSRGREISEEIFLVLNSKSEGLETCAEVITFSFFLVFTQKILVCVTWGVATFHTSQNGFAAQKV